MEPLEYAEALLSIRNKKERGEEEKKKGAVENVNRVCNSPNRQPK